MVAPVVSRLHLSQHGRFHAVSLETAPRDAQTINCLNWSRNVSKFYAWQVVSLMNEHGKSKFVGKADPLSIIRNKLIAQGEKLGTSAKLWVLVSNILIVAAFKAAIYEVFFFVYFAVFRTASSHSFFFAVHFGVLHVFKEIWRWFQ